MNHRHRSRYAQAAWLLGVVAVAAAAAGLVVGGTALVTAAVVAAAAAVVACVLLVRAEVAARATLAEQRQVLDARLDARLAAQRSGSDAALAAVQARVERSERDRRQLEIAVQMAMLRRERASSAADALDQVRPQAHL